MLKRTVVSILVIGTLSLLVTVASAQMRKLTIDASKVQGTIRSLQGVNRGPLVARHDRIDVTKQYKDVGVQFVRTHDYGGPTDIYQVEKGKVVEGTIFPDWDADPEKPESYAFEASDRIIKGIVDNGAQVYYRLGRSFTADPTVPFDFDKFADICKHIAMHYNDGWGNGFHFNIRYWELWNEPNIAPDWTPGDFFPIPWGAPAIKFFQLYKKVADALKEYDPNLKVGACGMAEGQRESVFREGLIEYCADNKAPLDFFSWHHYAGDSNDPYDFVRIANVVRGLLDDNGFQKAENHCTEWNMSLSSKPGPQDQSSMDAAAFTASSLIYMQDAIDMSLYYSGSSGGMGMFERDGSYRKKAYAFKANGKMLNTPKRLEVSGADTYGFGVLAGRSDDGKTVQVLISNYEILTPQTPPEQTAAPGSRGLVRRKGIRNENNKGYELSVSNLPWGKRKFTIKRYRISEKENLDLVSEASGKDGKLELKNELLPPCIELIVLEEK